MWERMDGPLPCRRARLGRRGPTQADILIDLAGGAELFHAPDGTAFADLDINGHRETWPVRSKGFKRWLARQYVEATQDAASLAKTLIAWLTERQELASTAEVTVQN